MKSKFLLVALVLLTFIGQATLAVAMPCAEMEQSHHVMAASMADHKAHAMMDMNMSMDHDQQGMSDCCDPECQCPMGGCLSASLVAEPHISALALVSENIRDRDFSAISQPPNSPYYPPIYS